MLYKNKYKISHVLRFITSNLLLEYVVSLMRYMFFLRKAEGAGPSEISYEGERLDDLKCAHQH